MDALSIRELLRRFCPSKQSVLVLWTDANTMCSGKHVVKCTIVFLVDCLCQRKFMFAA